MDVGEYHLKASKKCTRGLVCPRKHPRETYVGVTCTHQRNHLTKGTAVIRTHAEQECEDSDLEDIFVEAGSVKDMETALEKARALKAMIASGLPSKVRPQTLATLANTCNLSVRQSKHFSGLKGKCFAGPVLQQFTYVQAWTDVNRLVIGSYVHVTRKQ